MELSSEPLKNTFSPHTNIDPKQTMSTYFAEDDKIMREWQNEVRTSYKKTCDQHLLLFDRYQRLPEHIRCSDRIGGQILEDLGELSRCKTYRDTLWGGILALLGGKFEENEVASFSDLGIIEDFVERAQEDVKKLEKAVAKLETCVPREDTATGKVVAAGSKLRKGGIPRGPRALAG